MQNYTYACPPCRFVNRHGGPCVHCGTQMRCMGRKWRPPKKHNNKAWKLILSGALNWDIPPYAHISEEAAELIYQNYLKSPNISFDV